MNRLRQLILTVMLVTGASPATAASLSYVPSHATLSVGQAIAVDVVIAGLTQGGAPSVGAFDLDVSFDPAILSPTAVTFGPYLGTIGPVLDPNSEAIAGFQFLPGVIDFFSVSLLTNLDLDALQPASFTLATLSFEATTLGISALTFTQVIVDDGFSSKIETTTTSGAVSVVPEPSTVLLFGSGLVLVTLAARRREE